MRSQMLAWACQLKLYVPKKVPYPARVQASFFRPRHVARPPSPAFHYRCSCSPHAKPSSSMADLIRVYADESVSQLSRCAKIASATFTSQPPSRHLHSATKMNEFFAAV